MVGDNFAFLKRVSLNNLCFDQTSKIAHVSAVVVLHDEIVENLDAVEVLMLVARFLHLNEGLYSRSLVLENSVDEGEGELGQIEVSLDILDNVE